MTLLYRRLTYIGKRTGGSSASAGQKSSAPISSGDELPVSAERLAERTLDEEIFVAPADYPADDFYDFVFSIHVRSPTIHIVS